MADIERAEDSSSNKQKGNNHSSELGEENKKENDGISKLVQKNASKKNVQSKNLSCLDTIKNHPRGKKRCTMHKRHRWATTAVVRGCFACVMDNR